MRSRLVSWIVALGTLFAVAADVPASATMLEIKGSEGTYFKETCPGEASYLVGFSARTGAWFDSLQLLCQDFVASKTGLVQGARAPAGAVHGGSGAPRLSNTARPGWLCTLSLGIISGATLTPLTICA